MSEILLHLLDEFKITEVYHLSIPPDAVKALIEQLLQPHSNRGRAYVISPPSSPLLSRHPPTPSDSLPPTCRSYTRRLIGLASCPPEVASGAVDRQVAASTSRRGVPRVGEDKAEPQREP